MCGCQGLASCTLMSSWTKGYCTWPETWSFIGLWVVPICLPGGPLGCPHPFLGRCSVGAGLGSLGAALGATCGPVPVGAGPGGAWEPSPVPPVDLSRWGLAQRGPGNRPRCRLWTCPGGGWPREGLGAVLGAACGPVRVGAGRGPWEPPSVPPVARQHLRMEHT